MRPTHIGSTLIVVAALLALPAHADLISNGSFETGPDPGVAMTLPVDNTSVPGWTVTRNAIRYVGTNANAPDGVRSIALNGSTAGGISQTIATSPGTAYTMTFFIGSDPFPVEPYVKQLRIQAAGQTEDFSFDGIHAWPWDIGWQTRTFQFTANAASTTIEIWSLMDGASDGPAIDNLRVEPTLLGVQPTQMPLALSVPWPNPSSGQFEVSFSLPTAGPARLTLVDLQGREVGVLANGTLPAGRHFRIWNGRAAGSKSLRAGVYFLRLEAAGALRVQRVVFTR